MNKSKLITLILTLALVVASIFAVSVVASADDAAVPTITSKNLYFETNTQIAVQVSASGTLPTGAQLGIMVYDSENVATIADFNPETAKLVHTSYKTEKMDGKDFYLTQSIPANDMSYPYIIVPVIKNGDNVTYGAAQFYSVVNYAYDKLNELNTSVKLAKVCDNIIKYAAAAEGALGANGGVYKFGYAEAVNGYVGNFTYTAGGVTGDTVVLRADAIKDGKYFTNWTNAAGEVVSAERVTTVKITSTSGAEVYTANYSDKADSAYAYINNIDGLSLGKCTTNPGWWEGTLSNSAYSIYAVVNNGDKELLFDKPGAKNNGSFGFVADKTYNEASFDLTFAKYVSNCQNIYTTLKLTNGTNLKLRTNIHYSGSKFCFYADGNNGNKQYARDDAGNIAYCYLAAGQTITLRTVCDTENAELDFYINGEYFGSISILEYYVANMGTSGRNDTIKALAEQAGILLTKDLYKPLKYNNEYVFANATVTYTEIATTTTVVANEAGDGFVETVRTLVTTYVYEAGELKSATTVSDITTDPVASSKTAASTTTTYAYTVDSCADVGTETKGSFGVTKYYFGWTNDFISSIVVDNITFN